MISLDTDSVDLIKGEPSYRRRFLDEIILYINPHYSFSRAAYYRALRQRLSVLIDPSRFNKASLGLYLDELESIMSQQGGKIVKYRGEAVKKLERRAVLLQEEFPLGGSLTLSYQSVVEGEEEKAKELIKANLLRNRALDRERGRTSFGPHLDELDILLEGRPARFFASEGQRKLATFLLYFAAYELITEETKESPVLLIDDFPSVLDEKAATFIIDFLKEKGQAILTVNSQYPGQSSLLRPDAKTRICM